MSKKKKKAKPPQNTDWDTLRELITAYAAAFADDAIKGGGDPADYEVVELRMKLACAELGAHIQKMERKLEE